MLFGVCTESFAQGAQKHKVTGVVQDASGEPLIGVTVAVNGSSTGTVTDIDGNFSLDVPSNATLTFSYVGYLSQKTVVGNQSSMNIVLEEDRQQIDEEVVVGYKAITF